MSALVSLQGAYPCTELQVTLVAILADSLGSYIIYYYITLYFIILMINDGT